MHWVPFARPGDSTYAVMGYESFGPFLQLFSNVSRQWARPGDTLRLLGAIEIHCNRAVYVSLNTNNTNPNPNLNPNPK